MRPTRRALPRKFLSGALGLIVAIAACRKSPALAKEEYFKRGNEYAAAGKYSEATLEYSNALRQDPNYGEAEVALGNAYHELGDRARAAKSYSRAADLLPENKDVQIKAGTM